MGWGFAIGRRTGKVIGMSKLYLGTDPVGLAEQLAQALDQANQAGDSFQPARIVVPHRYLGKWLRLWLARKQGVAINLEFAYLEDLLGELLRELDPRDHPLPLQMLDEDSYRMMVLSLLLDETDTSPELQPLRDWVGSTPAGRQRQHYRQAWQLASRLARHIRDYEYHRQDALIQPWLKDLEGYPRASAHARELERSQRALFRRIVAEPDGLRAVLGRASNRLLKTLPQYACEILELRGRRDVPRQTLHLFGISQISALHLELLHELGRHQDLRIYYLNPLAGRLAGRIQAGQALKELAERFRGQSSRADHAQAADLCAAWGKAGAESLYLMAGLTGEPASFEAEVIPTPPAPSPTLLRHLQAHLLGGSPGPESCAQDRSLQIVACPGMTREVETVYQSILHNLHEQPGLQLTDIAVMVTDLARYRPVLQAVFDRQPGVIPYNLGNFSAAGLSAWGDAALGMLDLALESFTRSRVFDVVLNPCFLARLGMERDQALIWLDWAEALGVHQGWDGADKGAQASPLYSWKLGLQRLRLGRLMEVTDENAPGPAVHYREVIPFADLESGDRTQLDAFCRAVEGLLPRLARLRKLQASGETWAAEILRLLQDFLAIAEDRAGDERVREKLFFALGQLKLLDQLRAPRGDKPRLPLALIREFVQENLEAVEGTQGDYLTGGVTIAPLSSLRGVPFRIVYLLGLGEDLFPGSNTVPTSDLRSREQRPGDIRPAESNRFLFLEALLAARDKAYLLYNCWNLQKDEVLQPGIPLNQLARWLTDHPLGGQPFHIAKVPLQQSDPALLGAQADAPWSDVLVCHSPGDRLLALAQAQRAGQLALTEQAADLLKRRIQKAGQTVQPAASTVEAVTRTPTVALSELTGFLRCPAEAALKRHLRFHDEDEREPADDEPFWTGFPDNYRLPSAFLKRFVMRAMEESVDGALAGWHDQFAGLYADWQRRGRVPEEAFGEVDQARFTHLLGDRLADLESFLRTRQQTFIGPVLLGESITPIGARQRFPALDLDIDTASKARLVGSQPLVWCSEQAVDVLLLTGKKKIDGAHLSPPLLEPILFLLALKAGKESRDWLGERTFGIHVVHGGGLTAFDFLPGDISNDDARNYLTELTRDFLDSRSFDLLPFDLVAAGKHKLRGAYLSPQDKEFLDLLAEPGSQLLELIGPHPGPVLPLEPGVLHDLNTAYAERFREELADDEDDMHRTYRGMRLMEIVEAKVPADALDKIRRRFWLLDRALARQRGAGSAEEAGENGEDDGDA